MNVNHRTAGRVALVSGRRFAFAFTVFSMLQLAATPLNAQYVDWVRQWGTPAAEAFWGVSVDTAGTIYAVGDTSGSGYATQAGGGDALLVKYDASGNLLGGFQDGTSTSSDRLTVAAADGAGGVFVSGYTSNGTFGPPRTGSGDNVFGRISPSNTWTWL